MSEKKYGDSWKNRRQAFLERASIEDSTESSGLEEDSPIVSQTGSSFVQGKVLASIARMLLTPNAMSKTVHIMHKGDLVAVLGQVGYWTKVKTINDPIREGYILSEYLTVPA